MRMVEEGEFRGFEEIKGGYCFRCFAGCCRKLFGSGWEGNEKRWSGEEGFGEIVFWT
jgi:hypothetical protein